MGLFTKSVIREINNGAWGHLISAHRMDVTVLSNDIRCVEKKGCLTNGEKVVFMRLFSLKNIKEKDIKVENWETFDQHPDQIIFEGYLKANNEAHLERKQP